MKGFGGRELKRLRSMHRQVVEIQATLGSDKFKVREVSLPATQATEVAAKLEAWIGELIWIAERELCPQSPEAQATTGIDTHV